ncbi:MAG: 5-(carboxyamino)imidazole ribonucleotide synthase [Saprospiraceae bacterium]|nr:5-(carboxyamino)imidazole ribonucleotide synthase [Saprospiraceae bacterium]
MITNTRIGVLGGGQLGKMLAQAGSRWNLNLWLTDKDFDFPAAAVTNKFIQGDFTSHDLVYQLGHHVDIITIEIENVNTDALIKLEKEGKEIYPQPGVIQTIKDKGLQKQFYRDHAIPTSAFQLVVNASEVRKGLASGSIKLPFVQKSRTEGYDGRGVQVMHSEADLEQLFNRPSVIEELISIKKEIAVLVARNPAGQIVTYPAVEMAFHPTANLVEQLISPARIDPGIEQQAETMAKKIIQDFDMVGLLAIEFFLTQEDQLLVNEVAPRPHNSGHHTIEGNITSQYEQLLRAILDLPLGDTSIRSPAVMINLLGEPGHQGEAHYQGLDKVLAMKDVHVHIYGKKETKPFRKMGHVTILDKDIEVAIAKAKEVARTLKVVS